MEKKAPKFNVIDVLAVACIVLLAVVVLWKFAAPDHAKSGDGSASGSSEAGDDVHITFVVKAENVAAEVYENVQEHIPGQLMASGELCDGWVVAVEKQPCRVLAANGTWVEDPAHVTLLFTVEADVPAEEVMTTLVGNQEVRIGRPGYILKTEYIELRDTVVVDVQWDFGAGNQEQK